MMSLIDVTCPHCGAKGRIMAPPLGSIIFGPCPECQGMVTIFCGQALPLDKDIMYNGSPAEKREHLLEALGLFLQERIDQLFQTGEETAAQAIQSTEPADNGVPEEAIEEQQPVEKPKPPLRSLSISEAELDTFKNIELKLIDNKEYFRAVFR